MNLQVSQADNLQAIHLESRLVSLADILQVYQLLSHLLNQRANLQASPQGNRAACQVQYQHLFLAMDQV